MLNRINKKFFKKFYDFLKMGVTPNGLALAIVFGFAIGTFPILGIATIMSAAVAFGFRLNMIVIQLMHYLVYPIQLILFVPFIKLGYKIFHDTAFPYTAKELVSMFQSDLVLTLKELWLANMMGIITWSIFIIPISFVMYYFLKSRFKKLQLAYLK